MKINNINTDSDSMIQPFNGSTVQRANQSQLTLDLQNSDSTFETRNSKIENSGGLAGFSASPCLPLSASRCLHHTTARQRRLRRAGLWFAHIRHVVDQAPDPVCKSSSIQDYLDSTIQPFDPFNEILNRSSSDFKNGSPVC